MSIEIREALPDDSLSIWNLIHDLAVYEKAPTEMTLRPEVLKQDMEEQRFTAFVAVSDGNIVGMALMYPIYSTWKGASWYLEDFIVSESFRRNGIGTMLFEKVISFAKEKNAGRLGWQVLNWNQPAIEFYKRYRTEFDTDWITCRIRGEDIQNFNPVNESI